MSKPSAELVKLKRWMEEFVLDRRMGGDEPEESLQSEEIDFSGQAAPESHQIRLWPSAGEPLQPLYGLIVQMGYLEWRILPFSPYAFAAVPEELRVREDPPVRVVQGWNARVLTEKQVRESWVVADLPADQILTFERWWLAVQGGADDFSVFGDQTGPLLRHPLDPRIDYMDTERARVDNYLGEASGEYRVVDQQKAAEPLEGDEGYGVDPERILSYRMMDDRLPEVERMGFCVTLSGLNYQRYDFPRATPWALMLYAFGA